MHQLLSRQLWQEALRLGRSQLLLWPAVRQASGIALIYALVWNTLGPVAQPLALAAAAGALMAGLAAVTGPSRTRGRILLSMTLLLGLSVALGLRVGEYGLLAAGVVGIGTFGFAMLAAANPLYQTIAVISVSYMVSYAAQDLPAELWWSHGLAIVVGGLLQLFYLTRMWPLPPLQPERQQLAQVYRDLAEGVRQLPGQPRPGLMLHHSAALAGAQVITVEHYHPQWQAQQRELTRLLDCLYDLDAALTGYGVRAAHWLAELDGPAQAADTPAEVSSSPAKAAAQAEVSAVTEAAATLLDRFAVGIEAGHWQLDGLAWGEWQATLTASPPALAREAQSVLAAVQLLRTSGTLPELSVQRRADEPVWQELLRPWRDPHRLQFSAYYGLSIGALTYFSDLLPWENSSWLVMTYALIFSSDYQRLLTRGLARIGGTVAAMALILLIQQLFGLTEALSTALFLLASYLVVATVQAGYLAVTLAFTVYTFATMNRWEVQLAAADRLWMTSGGVLLAVLAYQLWPNWHVRRLPQLREEAVQALRDFMAAQRTFAQHLTGTSASTDQPGERQPVHAAANAMRRALLKMGEAYKAAAEVAGASRAEPIWSEYSGGNPLEELEVLESLAAETAGIYAHLLGGTLSPRQAAQALARTEQRLDRLELSELPQPRALPSLPLLRRRGTR
ncbi:hypothetical protein Deipr_1468 [Deinococcus proteolyticus MRP]|uniref:Uncharacterized protein n=1 Tax=Deinococcus proteolyticus (strain ATCC 35074 / DSM 20540 / JCM 6276 / NBRC 101906 / NCIMB 13154 / VKM Ac-1939 / CCM 2703 / MRP) TaxID=693977 RepID=F0RJN9_DEIPM|nr:FUSC family protein [Deinococcus proteolyticus]ADY26609.1 hypothetical protein Deipr_1468 [Deinococcus proteolyticus MRP]